MFQLIEFGCERYDLEGENGDIVTVSVNIPGISEDMRLSFERSKFEEIMDNSVFVSNIIDTRTKEWAELQGKYVSEHD